MTPLEAFVWGVAVGQAITFAMVVWYNRRADKHRDKVAADMRATADAMDVLSDRLDASWKSEGGAQ